MALPALQDLLAYRVLPALLELVAELALLEQQDLLVYKVFKGLLEQQELVQLEQLVFKELLEQQVQLVLAYKE